MMVETERSPLVGNYVPFRELMVRFHLLPMTLSVIALGVGSGAVIALGVDHNLSTLVRVVCMMIGIFAATAALYILSFVHCYTSRTLENPDDKPLITLVKVMTAATALVGLTLSISSFFIKWFK